MLTAPQRLGHHVTSTGLEGMVLHGFFALLHVSVVLCADKGTAMKNWDEGGSGDGGKK
jgi:hypothetical protein